MRVMPDINIDTLTANQEILSRISSTFRILLPDKPEVMDNNPSYWIHVRETDKCLLYIISN